MQISVITATYNAGKHLPTLIKSLRAQTNKHFEWVVADGGSTDETLATLEAINDLNIVLSSRADFGIYDALNRAIKMSSGEFYVVIGSDDIFEPTAIEIFSKKIDDIHTVITCPILINNKVSKLSFLPVFLSGSTSKICGHSMATLFKKSLHDKYGYYSKKYPIAADYDFMMKLVMNKENIKFCSYIVGKYGTSGVSATDYVGSASEVMRVMISNGFSVPIQVTIFMFRLLYSTFKSRKNV
jgi:glycosyltransferase involved in cell wall biosynthesis